jgi:hypothetical protein
MKRGAKGNLITSSVAAGSSGVLPASKFGKTRLELMTVMILAPPSLREAIQVNTLQEKEKSRIRLTAVNVPRIPILVEI